MTGCPILDSLTLDQWLVIGLGCIAVILVPSIVIGATVADVEWLFRIVRRRRTATFESVALPTAPAAAPVEGIDAEWADIESAIRGSR